MPIGQYLTTKRCLAWPRDRTDNKNINRDELVNISGSVEAAFPHDIHSNLYHLNAQILEMH